MAEPSVNIWEFYGIKHTKILQTALQKTESALQKYFTKLANPQGKYAEIPYIGAMKSQPQKGRYDKLNRVEPTFWTRGMRPQGFVIPTPLSSDDKVYNNTVDYQIANVITEHRNVFARDLDDVALGVRFMESGEFSGKYVKNVTSSTPTDVYNGITGGLLGTNYVGQDGLTLETLDDQKTGEDSFVIDKNYVASGTPTASNLTFDKIKYAIHLLRRSLAYQPGRTTMVLVINSAMKCALEHYDEYTHNMEYMLGNMRDGMGQKLLGCQILESECLPYITTGDNKGSQVAVLFIKEHAYYGVWDDMKVRVDPPHPDYRDMSQVVTSYSIGACRKYKNSVVQICCDTTK